MEITITRIAYRLLLNLSFAKSKRPLTVIIEKMDWIIIMPDLFPASIPCRL